MILPQLALWLAPICALLLLWVFAGPTLALSMTKQMINNELNMDLVSALEAEAQAQALLMMGEDHRRFYEAFKAKEKPAFIGK